MLYIYSSPDTIVTICIERCMHSEALNGVYVSVLISY